MAFTNEAAEKLLKGFIGQGGGNLMSSLCYMGLSTTPPSEDGTNFTEPSESSGYSRTLIGEDDGSAGWVMTVTNHTAENTSIIYFPEATASWGTVTHFGLFNSLKAEKPLIYGTLSSPVSVPANYVPLFRVGQFSMTLS